MTVARPAELQQVAATLLRELDRLVVELTGLITAKIDLYAGEHFVSIDELAASLRENITNILTRLSGNDQDMDFAVAEWVGTTRAGQGMPLPEVLRAYRLAFVFL